MYEPTPEALVAATAEEIVRAIAADADRLALFRKRFVLALGDIGWLAVVGPEWVRIGTGGLEFGPLTHKQADVLLRDLEDFGRDKEPRMHSIHPDQTRLF